MKRRMNRESLSRVVHFSLCELGLKIYYLCDSYLLALLRLSRIFFKLFGKRARTSTIFSSSFCTSVGVSSEHEKPSGCLSHVIVGSLARSLVRGFTLLLLLILHLREAITMYWKML